MTRRETAFVFDLDGTLVDSVYQHVVAWGRAIEALDIEAPLWRLHRRIGMGSTLFAHALLRDAGREPSEDAAERLIDAHTQAYQKLAGEVRPFPGSSRLLRRLDALGRPWAIATSSKRENAVEVLERLGVGGDAVVVTSDEVARGKPDPDLFLEAVRRLDVAPEGAFVVGDSVWDILAARRAGLLGIGTRTGGFGEEELLRAGAYRVYDGPADLLAHLDETGAAG